MFMIILIAKLCEKLLRLFGRGATTLPGRVALFLKKDVLKRLSESLKIIIVTGTNGKTTTARMIENALLKAGKTCFLNRSGANLITGITTAFLMNCDLRGRCKAEYAVVECDENALKKASLYFNADCLVVTNVFRDQLDRYGEVSSTLAAVAAGARNMPNAKLVLNADDPVSFSLSKQCVNFASFGIDKNLNLGGKGESEFCPVCREKLEYSSRTYCQLGNYACKKCGYRRIKPDVCADEILLNGENGSFVFFSSFGREAMIKMNVGGIYNAYNALAAVCALQIVGVNIETAVASLSSFGGVFGRAETFGGTQMLLVKNPAGFTQTMNYLSSCDVENLIFVLNDNDADGKDVSWIWDAEIEFPKNTKNVYAFGIRSGDMALRLKYAGVECEVIGGYNRFFELAERDKTAVVATYTAMMALRPYFAQKYNKKEFWK